MPSSEPAKRFDVGAEKRDKPWKYKTVYAVTVLEWVVGNSTVSLSSDSAILSAATLKWMLTNERR